MQVTISQDRMKEVGEVVAGVMNTFQVAGLTIDEAICGMLFMAGSAIKQRGATLRLDKPLREALPPVVLGYEASETAEAWQIEAMETAKSNSKQKQACNRYV